MRWLSVIRSIKPEGSREATERYNSQLDNAWKYFNANKAEVLPILRRELAVELKKTAPNQMLLLDIGYFVRRQDGPADKELGRHAFFAIDTDAEIVRWNGDQLFKYAHLVVPDRDARTLALLDKAFLRGKITAFVPQHAMHLDETLVCVFLYGVFGHGAERHLIAQLARASDRAVAQRIIEILVWIGSPEAVPAVAAAMRAHRDYDTLVRGTAFMMMAGGPQGRTAMLDMSAKEFDKKAADYFAKIRNDVEKTTYQVLVEQFRGFAAPEVLSGAELKARLADMHRNHGRDNKTSPRTLLESKIPASELIERLSRIRERTLFRLSDEALSDVKVTNSVLNALRYKR